MVIVKAVFLRINNILNIYRESSNKTETSFSSSRQEKSKIVVEKVDGVVEPNISSPNKLQQGSSEATTVNGDRANSIITQTQLESVPASLSARIER